MQFQQFLNANAKFILFGILVFAFGLRFYKIGEHGLAGDEKYSLFVSQFVTYEGNNQHDSVRKPNDKYFTPKEFWSEKSTADFFDSIARLDTGNGALYTYTLHFWTNLFGLEDTSLRMLSLLFNLLTISLLYIFVKTHFHSKTLALLAVFLAAISPFYIVFSQVARNYSMNMFFALLATYLLLKIIESEEKNEKPVGNYIFYGLSALACEMCHFSTFPLFFIHALYVLIYFRKIRGYIGLILAMIIPAIGVLVWLKSEGGKWLFDYVSNSTKVYNEMAVSNPDEYLSIANIKNILKQLRYVVSAMFLSIDGLPSLTTISRKIYFIIVSASAFSLLIYIQHTLKLSDSKQQKLRVFIFLLAFFPFLTLIAFSYQDGNTFRIMPRYIAYSYCFNLILTSLIIRDLWYSRAWVKYPAFVIFAIQFFIITKLILFVWSDNAPRYFMSFPEPRNSNPYLFSAKQIQQQYAKGDTVLYPSIFVEKRGGIGMPSYSVVDAQLTNFYLPKDSEILQSVDINEPDKIILQKADGSKLLIFDFKGTKYRY
jgi:hypothetical protein